MATELRRKRRGQKAPVRAAKVGLRTMLKAASQSLADRVEGRAAG
jgi:hypothetical protein